MKKETERDPSEMGKEILELREKYHEYFSIRDKYLELLDHTFTVGLITIFFIMVLLSIAADYYFLGHMI